LLDEIVVIKGKLPISKCIPAEINWLNEVEMEKKIGFFKKKIWVKK
jgi:hypothetical protein